MKWLVILVSIYASYYTLMYALSLGRENKKAAMLAVMFLAINALVLPILVLFKFIRIGV